MVNGPVDDRGSHLIIPEDLPPPGELKIRGVYDAAFLVRVSDHLEQQPRPLVIDREIPELVNDDQLVPTDLGQLLLQHPRGGGLSKLRDLRGQVPGSGVTNDLQETGQVMRLTPVGAQ